MSVTEYRECNHRANGCLATPSLHSNQDSIQQLLA